MYKMLRPIDRVDGLQIEIPGAGTAVYRKDTTGMDSLSLTDEQRDVIRRARKAYRAVAALASAAGDEAEQSSDWLDGFEPEAVGIDAVVYSRDCTRPDGSESGTGETRSPGDSPEYNHAFQREYSQAMSLSEDSELANWIVKTGVIDLIVAMEYRGHDLGLKP